MRTNIRQYIQEMISLLNDDAIFHQRDIPGNQDDFEDRLMSRNPATSRHELYSSIDDMIKVYDALGDDYNDEEIAAIVQEIKSSTAKLVSRVR
jgi:hypothetical protein